MKLDGAKLAATVALAVEAEDASNGNVIAGGGSLRQLEVPYFISPGIPCPWEVNTSLYPQLKLYRDGGYRWHFIHLLVATVFIGPIPEGYEVNHKKGNKMHAHVSKLEILTKGGNARHAVQAGLRKRSRSRAEVAALRSGVLKLHRRRHYTISQIAGRLDMSPTSVRKIIRDEAP